MQYDPYNQNTTVLHEIRAGRALETTESPERRNAKEAIKRRMHKTISGEPAIEAVMAIQIKPGTQEASERKYASETTEQVARIAIPTTMLTRQEREAVNYPSVFDPSESEQATNQQINPYGDYSSATNNLSEALKEENLSLANKDYSAKEHTAFIDAVADSSEGNNSSQPLSSSAPNMTQELNADLHQEQVNAIVRAREAVWQATKDLQYQNTNTSPQVQQQVLSTHGSIERSDYATAA